MRIIFTFFICLFCNCLYSQSTGKTFYFDDVKWELTIPNDFELKDAARTIELQNKGVQSIEKANKINLGDLSDLKTLISAFKGKFEYLNSTIRKYDQNTEGNYESTGKVVNNVVYRTIYKEIADGYIDTSSTKENIGGLIFDKFQLTLSREEKKVFTMVVLSKLYKGLDFGITYLYTSDSTKREIEILLKNSKFKK